MKSRVYRINRPDELRKAGPGDLVQLLPAPGANPLFIPKETLEILVCGIVSHEYVHLSGPTGSAKTSLIEALTQRPENFYAISNAIGFASMPLKVYPIEMATYETPGELYFRRALRNGCTYDEKSPLVLALEDASGSSDVYCLVWLREMGRVHSAAVQGGLLDLMTKARITFPDGSSVPGGRISWIADSNYQAESESTHTLVTQDDALKRRFPLNVTLDYLSPEQEVSVLEHLLGPGVDGLAPKVVKLGTVIRRHKIEGNLQSLVPPTIYGYHAFLRMAKALPHFAPQQIARFTILGNASPEDQKMLSGVFNEAFGLRTAASANDPLMGGKLF